MFEFPFDPVTPDRMVVGRPEEWFRAPLPAGFDWCSRMWFPWTAYLGVGRLPEEADELIWETRMNWVAPGISRWPDLIETPALLTPAFFQGASPGMSLPDLPLGSTVQLSNLHPEYPVFPVTVPHDPPRACLELQAGSWTELQPRLNAMVIRPDEEEVVMVWRADVERPREYMPADLAGMARWVGWPSSEGGG